jgi:DNA-binding IclR family transcriptional regulator
VTAIDAAIVELEAHREHVCQVIATLRRFARVVEEAHVTGVEPVGAPTVVIDGRALVAAVSRQLPATTTTTAPTSTTNNHTAKAYQNDAKVLKALSGEWMSIEVVAARAKLPKGTAYTRLSRLSGSGQVATRPEGKRTLYRLAGTPAATPLRSGPAAGTPRGPAGGTGPDHRTAGEAFETVWNGTKERNGEAPSILPPRERKA